MNYQHLDRLSDRIVIVVLVESLYFARIVRGGAALTAIAAGREPVDDGEVRRLELDIEQRFAVRYRALGLPDAPTMFSRELFVISLAKSCKPHLHDIVRAARAVEPDVPDPRISVTQMFGSPWHEFAVDLTELGFEELAACGRLAAQLEQRERTPEIDALIRDLRGVYATRFDDFGITLRRLADDAVVTRSELERAAARFLT